MEAEHRIFQFDEFTLTPRENSLVRSGISQQITPKAFRLLCILVENSGHVLDKDYLLREVWDESFVEEGNLTFNIRQLRLLLGDNARAPRFIETIPKRGYRFIGKVLDISDNGDTVSTVPVEQTERHSIRNEVVRHPPWIIIILVALAIGSFAAIMGLYGIFEKNEPYAPPLLAASSASEKLTTEGNVRHAAISNSGQFVVYAAGMYDEKSSLQLHYLDTGQTMEILPPMDHWYMGLDISPDDSNVYFVRTPAAGNEEPCLFRLSLRTTIPEKLICGVEGWFDLSSDGSLISFVSCPHTNEEYCSLFVADNDGKNERRIATRPAPLRIGDSSFSPDGSILAFAAGQSRDNANDFGVYLADLSSGTERPASTEKFKNVKQLSWFPDGNSLLISALKSTDEVTYFWHLIPESGSAQPLKKDALSYNTVSLSRTGDLLVSTVVDEDFRMYVGELSGNGSSNPIGRGLTPQFTSNGRLIFSSDRSGKTNIWMSDIDGGSSKRLTTDSVNYFPLIGNDPARIYFSSNRSGKSEVWEMHMDGSSPRQLTKSEGGYPIAVSPKSDWIYYISSINRTLWRVSADGQKEEQVSSKVLPGVALSPDTNRAAFFEQSDKALQIGIIPLEKGVVEKRIPLSGAEYTGIHVVWSKNSDSLYLVLSEKSSNTNSVWRQPLDGSKPTRLIDLGVKDLGERSGFAISPDDKYFAVVHGKWRHDAVLFRGLK